MSNDNQSGPQSNTQQSSHSANDLSIFQTTASLLEPAASLSCLPEDKMQILEAVRDLLIALGSGDSNRVEDALLRLGLNQDHSLFQRVGQMARSLHNSITDFKSSLARDNVSMDTTNIPDAADKLEAVIKMTYNAAEKTLGITEKQAEILTESSAEISKLKTFLKQAGNSTERAAMLAFLDKEESRVLALQNMNSEVLMTQEFQDLTGQALRKVIKLVTELESNLVSLIQIFGVESTEADAVKKEEPAAPSALVQDDVDSILNSFGF